MRSLGVLLIVAILDVSLKATCSDDQILTQIIYRSTCTTYSTLPSSGWVFTNGTTFPYWFSTLSTTYDASSTSQIAKPSARYSSSTRTSTSTAASTISSRTSSVSTQCIRAQPTAVVCPAANGTHYTPPGECVGSTNSYAIVCHVDYDGVQLALDLNATNIPMCVQSCNTNPQCVAIAFDTTRETCSLQETISLGNFKVRPHIILAYSDMDADDGSNSNFSSSSSSQTSSSKVSITTQTTSGSSSRSFSSSIASSPRTTSISSSSSLSSISDTGSTILVSFTATSSTASSSPTSSTKSSALISSSTQSSSTGTSFKFNNSTLSPSTGISSSASSSTPSSSTLASSIISNVQNSFHSSLRLSKSSYSKSANSSATSSLSVRISSVSVPLNLTSASSSGSNMLRARNSSASAFTSTTAFSSKSSIRATNTSFSTSTAPMTAITTSFAPIPTVPAQYYPFCPDDNGMVYIESDGSEWLLVCSQDYPGNDITESPIPVDDYSVCIDLCMNQGTTCVGVTFDPNAFFCYIKYAMTISTQPNGAMNSALRMTGPNGVSSEQIVDGDFDDYTDIGPWSSDLFSVIDGMAQALLAPSAPGQGFPPNAPGQGPVQATLFQPIQVPAYSEWFFSADFDLYRPESGDGFFQLTVSTDVATLYFYRYGGTAAQYGQINGSGILQDAAGQFTITVATEGVIPALVAIDNVNWVTFS